MAYSVVQRQREIGVRLALGAGPRAIRRLVLSESARLALLGLALGLGSAALLARGLRGLLFGIGPIDPITFGVAPVVLGLVTLLAAWLPARRAVRIDPLITMREE
jgi:ABC-type antimicrobial peptide transport system permease subunit